MLPHAPAWPQPAADLRSGQPVRIGVGIDTSRYGHYAVVLRDDFQPTAIWNPPSSRTGANTASRKVA